MAAKKKAVVKKKPVASKKAAKKEFVPNYSGILSGIEKKFRLSNAVMDKRARRSSAVSSGVLTTDLLIGNGGIVPGAWITMYGPEQSAKSTNAMTVVVESTKFLAPGQTLYFDYEGCVAAETRVTQADGTMKDLQYYIDKYANKPMVQAMMKQLDERNVGKDDRAKLGVGIPISNSKERVLSIGGWSYVSHLHYAGRRTPTILTFANGRVIRCSSHKFYVYKAEESKWAWVYADDMKVGDLVLEAHNGDPAYEAASKHPALEHVFHAAMPEVKGQWRVVPLKETTKGHQEEAMWDLTLSRKKGTLYHSHVTNGIVSHNSSDPNYIEQFHGNKLSAMELFGVRNPKSGEWEVEGKIRYYNEDVAETFFDSMKAYLNSLPNKVYQGGQWYYEYENTKPNRALVGDHYDKKLFQKTNKFMVPTSNTKLQALIIVDSYPAMLSDREDERDEGGGGVGEQARMFSANIKKIKGKLKRKGVAVVGVNQLRQRPMTMGNPEYEPGGEALKFFSDQRIRFGPVSLSTVGMGTSGMIMEEQSVQMKGKDHYRFVKAKVTKNKLAPAYMEGLVRLWIKDPNGKAHGIDPVFDVYQVGKMTGQLTGSLKKKMTITVYKDGNLKKGELLAKNLTWLDFKAWILASVKERPGILKKLKKAGVYKGKDPKLNLRLLFAKQIRDGIGEQLMFETLKNGSSGDDDDGGDDE